LLVAFALAVVLVGSALSIALSSRDMLTADERRTRLNQSLRGTLDLLGIDVRQAGERLPGDFPAIEIVDGASGGPDTLVLRRNLLDEVLPLCETLTAGEVVDEILVAVGSGSPPQGCAPVADDDADGWPDNIGAWRAHRDVGGGQVFVYIYNPVDRDGEWFLFDGDGTTSHQLHKGNGDPWQATYAINQQGRAYMLEERTYELDSGVLQFTRDTGVSGAVHVSANLIDFQVRAVMADGSIQDVLDSDDDWTQLRSVEVTVQARTDAGDDTMTRSLTARFFPRNILSN
jgi:type IV pilus assembly protein PilW